MKNSIKWEDYFYYDETSLTCLRWNISIYGGNSGKTPLVVKDSPAGTFALRKSGKPMCIRVKLNHKLYRVHRIIYELLVGKIIDKMIIDHLNQNPWDNRLCNLALKSNAENSRNRKMFDKNTSGFTGVQWICGSKGQSTTYAESAVTFNGKRFSKRFSVKQFGLLPAFKMACEWRLNQLKYLNDNFSANFTDNHGF